MSLRMCKDKVRGEITPRQKEAYRLFEAGDLEGANRILDFSEIKNEFLREEAFLETKLKKRAEIFIRETKTKIDILKMMIKLDSRFVEMEELYDEIVPVVTKYGIEFDTMQSFVWFLYRQNKHQKAYETAKSLEQAYLSREEKTEEYELAAIYHAIGTVCSGFPSKRGETEEYFLKAIEIREKLTKENPGRFNPYLAASCFNYAIFSKDDYCFEKALELAKTRPDHPVCKQIIESYRE